MHIVENVHGSVTGEGMSLKIVLFCCKIVVESNGTDEFQEVNMTNSLVYDINTMIFMLLMFFTSKTNIDKGQ